MKDRDKIVKRENDWTIEGFEGWLSFPKIEEARKYRVKMEENSEDIPWIFRKDARRGCNRPDRPLKIDQYWSC
jgi:hypothetical protein